MTTILDLDPNEFAPERGDVVRFSRGQFEWEVTRTVGDTLYVTSLIGKRQATTFAGNVVSIKRDSSYIPEADNRGDYTEDYSE